MRGRTPEARSLQVRRHFIAHGWIRTGYQACTHKKKQRIRNQQGTKETNGLKYKNRQQGEPMTHVTRQSGENTEQVWAWVQGDRKQRTRVQAADPDAVPGRPRVQAAGPEAVPGRSRVQAAGPVAILSRSGDQQASDIGAEQAGDVGADVGSYDY
ncbi:hypothetical protein AMECASPLE_025719 [Ameca splendens]|uniref:Uncharacterized protein n=1 Tax=Ameca splendens TaxID=208324 RepID=A0ABV0XHQ3_9TELE